ncbi:hypothetical protein P9112_013877 [Eukaryota sp. TZLM1-RC]
MKVLSGGYDSHPSRLLSTPGSTLEVGSPYPYVYDENTWFYANRSTLKMTDGSIMAYYGFVCFDNAVVGPSGTIIIKENATVCEWASLEIGGTELVIEGDATFCSLVLRGDFFGEDGSSLIITCDLTWYKGYIGGDSLVRITPEAYLYIKPDPDWEPSDEFEVQHILFETTRILNQGTGFVTANVSGSVDALFTNEGNFTFINGDWYKYHNVSDAISTFDNKGKVVVESVDHVALYWKFIQEVGEFVAKSGGFEFGEVSTISNKFTTKPSSQLFVSNLLTFDAATITFESPHFTPKNGAIVSFNHISVVSFDIEHFKLSSHGELVFEGGAVLQQSPEVFQLNKGVVKFLDVDPKFSIDNFYQTGGVLHVENCPQEILVDSFKFDDGIVETVSKWSINSTIWNGGEFTGAEVLSINNLVIQESLPKVCDSNVVLDHSIFTLGTVNGTFNCHIESSSFEVTASSETETYLLGCDSTFTNIDELSIESGSLILGMNLDNSGRVIVGSVLVLTDCDHVIDSDLIVLDDAEVVIDSPTEFSSNSNITGEGTITLNDNTTISGFIDFHGCINVPLETTLTLKDVVVANVSFCEVYGNVVIESGEYSEVWFNTVKDGNVLFTADSKLTLVNMVDINGLVNFDATSIDSLNVCNFINGTFVFNEPSVVSVDWFTQHEGTTHVNGQKVVFQHSNVTILGGGFIAGNGFEPKNAHFTVESEVFINQFSGSSPHFESLIINSGVFDVTYPSQFSINTAELNNGTFGGVDVMVEDFIWNNGLIQNDTTTTITNWNITHLGEKAFGSNTLVKLSNSGNWNNGFVYGDDGSLFKVENDSIMSFTGTNGWYTSNNITINSLIKSNGTLEFSTTESIVMEWDILSELIIGQEGVVYFQDSIVETTDLTIKDGATVYLRNQFNVSNTVSGDGDVVIDDPSSLVAFEGLVNTTGDLHMKDGLLDLRRSNIVNVSINYTGGIILFREDIHGDDINLPEVRSDLVIKETEAKSVRIGKCYAKITFTDVIVHKLLVEEMHTGCHLVFDEDSFIGKSVFQNMFDGQIDFNDGSDVKVDYLQVHDGEVSINDDSSPSFVYSQLIINGGKVTLDSGSSTKFFDFDTTMSGGELVIEEGGTKNCSQWNSLVLSGNGHVIIKEECEALAKYLEMNDESRLTSSKDFFANHYLFNGGFVGESTHIKAIDLFQGFSSQTKTFDSNSELTILDIGIFAHLSNDGSPSVLITFNESSSLNIPENSQLHIVSDNERTITFSTVNSDIWSGIVNEGVLNVSTIGNTIFEADLVSHVNSEMVFNENSLFELNGNTVVQDSGILHRNANVTIRGDFVQEKSSVFTIINGKVISSGSAVFNGKADCHLESGCFVVGQGNLTFSGSFESLDYIFVQVLSGNALMYGKLNTAKFDVSGGSLVAAHDSTTQQLFGKVSDGLVEFIEYCKVFSISNLTQSGGTVISNSNDLIDFTDTSINVSDGRLEFLKNSLIKNTVADISGGIVYIDAFNNDPERFVKIDAFNNDPVRFSFIQLSGGVLELEHNENVLIDNLLLNGGMRNGSSLLIIQEQFIWESGSLESNSKTISKSETIFQFDAEKVVGAHHELQLNTMSTFKAGELQLFDQALLINQNDAVFNITGAGKILDNSGFNDAQFINKEAALISKENCYMFYISVSLLNYGAIELREEDSCPQASTLAISGTSWSVGSINVLPRTKLEIAGVFYLNGTEESTTIGNGSIHLTEGNSHLLVSNNFGFNGQIVLESDYSILDLLPESTLSNLNVSITANATTNLLAKLPGLELHMSDGFFSSHASSSIASVSTLNLEGGVVDFLADSDVDLDDSIWSINNGSVFINDNSRVLINNVEAYLNGGLVLFGETMISNVYHFDTLSVCGGVLELNNNNSITTETFNLCGGTRSGNGNLNVTQYFSWTAGSLTDPGTTTLLATSLFTEDRPKDLENGHSLINFDEMTIDNTFVDLVNGSQLINKESGFVFFNNSAGFIGEIHTELDPSIINYGRFLVLEESSGTVSSDFFNYGDVSVLDDSIIDIGGINSFSIGLINVSYSSTIKIHGTFDLGSEGTFYGGGTLHVYSPFGFVSIFTKFDHINNIIVSDSARLTLSQEGTCYLYPSTVLVSNASLYIEHCTVDDLKLTVNDNGFVLVNGTVEINGFELDLESGFVGVADSASIIVTHSNWTLGPSISVLEFSDSSLVGDLYSLELLDNSLISISDHILSNFSVINLVLNGGIFNYSDSYYDLIVNNLASFNGNRTGSGNLYFDTGILIHNSSFTGTGYSEFANSSSCLFNDGSFVLNQHLLSLYCSGSAEKMVFEIIDADLLQFEQSTLSLSDTKIIGSNSRFESFGNLTIFNNVESFIESIIANILLVKTNSTLAFGDSASLDLASVSTLYGSIGTSESGYLELFGDVECWSDQCFINYGNTLFTNSSINFNVSITSFDGTTLLSPNSTFDGSTNVSSFGGLVTIDTDISHLSINNVFGGDVVLLSSVNELDLLSIYGGLVLFNNGSTVYSIPSIFQISGNSTVIADSGSTLSINQIPVEVYGGQFIIERDSTVYCGSPNNCFFNQSGGHILSNKDLEINILELSGGTFESNVSVDSMFTLLGGYVNNSIVEINSASSCDSSVISNTELYIHQSFITKCDSTIDLLSSQLVFLENALVQGTNTLLVNDLDDSFIEFKSEFSVISTDTFVFNSPTYLPFGVSTSGNLTISDPILTGVFAILEPGVFQTNLLNVSADSSFNTIGNTHSKGDITIYGSMETLGHHAHSGELTFTENSFVYVAIRNQDDYDSFSSSMVNYSGTLFINFNANIALERGIQFNFVNHDAYSGKFAKISGNCMFNFGFNYTESNLIGYVGRKIDPDYDAEIHVASWGYDSICCGTLQAPCKSLKTALSRALERDVIVFLDGVYDDYAPLTVENSNIALINGTGNVIDCNFKSRYGLEIKGESNISITGFTFKNCETAIKITRSKTFISDFNTISSIDSVSPRVLESVKSQVVLDDVVFTDLNGTLFSLSLHSKAVFKSIKVEEIIGNAFSLESSQLSINDFNISSLKGSIFNSVSSSIDINNAIVSESTVLSPLVDSVHDSIKFDSFIGSDITSNYPLFLIKHSSLETKIVDLSSITSSFPFVSSFKSSFKLTDSSFKDLSMPLINGYYSIIRVDSCNVTGLSVDNIITTNHCEIEVDNVLLKGTRTFIKSSNHGSVSVSDSNFIDGQSSAIITMSTDYVFIKNSIFHKYKTAEAGGALRVKGLNSQLSIHNSSFNECTADLFGGAIYAEVGYLEIDTSKFGKNVAVTNGGALFMDSVDSNSKISNSQFMDNFGSVGGAVFVNSSNIPQLESSQFTNNKASLYGQHYATNAHQIVAREVDFTTVAVAVVDAFNNTVNSTVSRTIYFSPTTSTVGFTGLTKTELVRGQALVSEVSVIGAPQVYQVVAFSSGLLPATFTFEGGHCVEGSVVDPSSGQCKECPAGTRYVDHDCEACPLGTWSSASASTSCSPCPPGTQRDVNDHGCTACDYRSVAPEMGSESCTPCPPRMGANQHLTECVCIGNLFKVDGDCIQCPPGLFCEAFNEYCVMDGFFQANDGTVYPCKKDGCVGNCTSDASCLDGFTGPLCSHCEEGHYPSGNLCLECPNVFFILLGILVQVGMYASIVPLIKLDSQTNYSSLRYYLPLVRFLQSLCAIRIITAIDLPAGIHRLFDLLDSILIRPWGSPIHTCTGLPGGFTSLYWTSALLLPTILVVGYVRRKIPLSMIMYQLFFAVPAHNLLAVFSCRSDSDSLSYFSEHYSEIQCFTVSWWLSAIVSSLYLLAFIGSSLYFIMSFKKYPFTATYASKGYSDEVVYQLHLLIITGALFMFESFGLSVQCAIGFIVCLCALAFNSKRRSYVHPKAHSLQGIYLLVEGILFMLMFVRGIDFVNTSFVFFDVVLILTGLLILYAIYGSLSSFVWGTVDNVKFTKNKTFATNILQNPFVHLGHRVEGDEFDVE